MFDDFTAGIIIGIGLCSWGTAMWIWFLMKTKIGRRWIENAKRRHEKKI